MCFPGKVNYKPGGVGHTDNDINILKVKTNGLLSTELVQIRSESEFSSPGVVQSMSFPLQDFQEVYQTDVYLELHRRTDEPAKAMISKDDKLRKKSFFPKFT